MHETIIQKDKNEKGYLHFAMKIALLSISSEVQIYIFCISE